MDLYKIICPYCKHEQMPFGYEKEGYGAVICEECGQPYVNQTTRTIAYHSYALVGIGPQEEPALPTKEEVQEASEADRKQQFSEVKQKLEEILLISEDSPRALISEVSPWVQTPGHKNGMYRIDGEYVEVRYLSSHPVRTTLADIHMLCEESNPTEAINSLLGTTQDTRNTAALNFLSKL